MYEQPDNTSWSFGLGLFVGAILGAAAASLLTPRSGPQARELVMEKGLVLRDRVSDTATSVTTSVKDTTTSAVSSVKEATNSAVAKVSDTASTAAEKVQTVASTAAERASSVAHTAADKARSITGQHDDTPHVTTTFVTTDVGPISEASYDSEDVRPVATEVRAVAMPAQPSSQLAADATVDLTVDTTPTPSATASAMREVRSDEQFEIAEPTDTTSVREASEGAERGA